jgi:hypothetical protein
MKRVLISLTLLSLGAFSQLALAGEWNPNKGEVPAKQNGNSECLFNGLDEPDIAFGGTEPDGPQGPDDPLWSSTPAGANGGTRVQAYGQLVAIGWKDFVPSPGEACNGHLNPHNP